MGKLHLYATALALTFSSLLFSEDVKPKQKVTYTITFTCDDCDEVNALSDAHPSSRSKGLDDWKARRHKELELLGNLIEKGSLSHCLAGMDIEESDPLKNNLRIYIDLKSVDDDHFRDFENEISKSYVRYSTPSQMRKKVFPHLKSLLDDDDSFQAGGCVISLDYI